MPTANPLEQLRRRMLTHATPTAFAALAEEHRRAGRFADAIAVCQEGLAQYPTYVSARVTLGRALLDSGDVHAAVAELEQAVAQAPDNLAAVRALESARTAQAEMPAPAGGDVTVQGSGTDADAEPQVATAAAEEWRDSYGLGPNNVEDLALGPVWAAPTEPDAAAAHGVPDPEWTLDSLDDTAPVETAANTWTDADPAAVDRVPAELDAADATGTASSWDAAPTVVWESDSVDVEAPVTLDAAPVDAVMVDPVTVDPVAVQTAEGAPDGVEPVLQAVPGADQTLVDTTSPVDPAAAHDVLDLSADPAAGGNGAWGQLLDGPVSEGAAPAMFAGWDAPGPAMPGRPDWAAPGTEPPPTPDATDPPPDTARVTSEVAQAEESPAPAPVPVGGWAGSLASALDEVFTQAGHPDSGQDPDPQPSTDVRAALASAAVEAAIEDTAAEEPSTPPALVSLQQMLDSVRARRAALFTDRES